MSLRSRLVLPILLSGLAALAGCSSSSNSSTPPPTGGFTDSDFSGTYVFSFAGTDFTNTATTGTQSFFAAAGTLVADSKGGLTGTIDLNDAELGSVLTTSSVQTGLAANGSYKVSSDGRGNGTVSVKVNGTNYQMGIDFVLTSDSHGLITRFDGNGTGSGTLDLQSSGVTQSSLLGSYAFALSGADSVGNSLGTIGTFTLDASGNATGLQDFNDNGDGLADFTLTSPSTVLVGTPGTAQLTSPVFGTLGFDVWVINATHLKLIETDTTGPVLAGDAYVSTGQSFPAGNLVYTLSGVDTSAGPIGLGGLLNTSSSTAVSGLEDVNDAGTVAQAPAFSGSYNTSSGRTTLTLSGIYNGGWDETSTSTPGTYTFAAYPFTYGGAGVGVVLLEVDGSGGTTSGIAYLQSSTAGIAASQGYGLNLSGANSSGNVDMIAEFSATSTDLTGLYDVNNYGITISDYTFGTTKTPGTYSVSSGTGRGTAQVPLQTNSSSVIDTLNIDFYAVDSTTSIVLEADTEQVAVGSFQQQNASGTAAAAALPHFSMAHPARAAARRHADTK